MRFVVPMRTVHAGPNPKYYGIGCGVTWYNMVSDQFTGRIPATGIMRTSQVGDKLTRLARGPAEFGRIDKTSTT